MNRKRANLFVGILLSVAFTSSIAADSGGGVPSPSQKLLQAKRAPLTFTLHLSGEIQSSTQSLVRAETGGVVGAILVTEGQLVQKGDVLCEITSRKKQTELNKAGHNTEVARLEVEKKNAELKTAENPEVVSCEIKIAQQKLAIAELERDELWADVERLKVKAPFSGRVVSIEVKVGDLVTGSGGFTMGSAILQLVPDAEYAINTNVGEHELVNVDLGKKVQVVIPALNDRVFEAQITRLAQVGVQTNSRARVFPLTITFSGGDASVRIGMTGKVNVPIARDKQVIMLPISLVQTDSSGSYINISIEGRSERRAVSLGLATASDVEIVSGINEGEQVVLR